MMQFFRICPLFFIGLSMVVMSIGYGSGCGGTSTGGNSLVTTTTPTWIVASWSGGAVGNPIDRTDTEATEFTGSLCPASSVSLMNQSGGFAGLTIINNCSILVTYAICATKGSDQSGVTNGLSACAQDPFDTPFSRLTFISLNSGPPGDFINATENLSVSVFFCSDTQQLSAPPTSDQVACL